MNYRTAGGRDIFVTILTGLSRPRQTFSSAASGEADPVTVLPPRPLRLSSDLLSSLIDRWRKDSSGTCQTWFLWEERLKNFRFIRRGIAEVSEIEAGTFGSAYKGSSLETVVRSIAEQPDLQGCRSRVPL